MTKTAQTEISSQYVPRYERLLIAVFCLLAAIRVLIFSSAFPFFNNADEQAHFDVVFKYSQGRLPSAPLEKFNPQAAEIIGDNETIEYLKGRFFEDFVHADPKTLASMYVTYNNHENWSWPTYYVIAGLWCRIGIIIGFKSGYLLYWIRFLNTFIVAALVWLSYLYSRKYLSGFQQRIAMPLIVAFFPQDIFFAITGDVLSPLTFGAAFFMLLEIYSGEKSPWYYLFAGLVTAATILTKTTNIVITAPAVVILLVKLKQSIFQRGFTHYLKCPITFALACGIPVGLWLWRNYIIFGDIVGSATAMKLLTWSQKPLSEIFDHPILTSKGISSFLIMLTEKFWRGEFMWALNDIAWAPMDWFYVVSSGLFCLATLLDVIKNKPKMNPPFRSALIAAFSVSFLSVLLLAFLSMRYDFGECLNPSRSFPFFIAGRLIAGTILPFLLIYITGLSRILSNLRFESHLLLVVVIIVVAITASEIYVSLPAFSSPYNWFHLK